MGAVSPPRVLLLILVLFTLGMISGLLGRRMIVGSVLLALTAVVWLLVDTNFEGPILFVITRRNGLTFADLFAFAGLGVAVVQLWLWSRRR